ncbi:MAG: site-2 protease family protein [Myxococcota bacterium]
MTPDLLTDLVIVLATLLPSLAIHEFAHALVARWLGDDTASRQGRLTLNPVSHIDPVGSLLLPGILVLAGTGFLFGWAKPVPFDPVRFTRRIRMKHGILLTALAGPVSNLLLAALLAVALGFFPPSDQAANVIFGRAIVLNVLLFVFNLLPIPPLDGSKIAYGLLPDSASGLLRFFEQRPWIAPVAFLALFLGAGHLLTEPVMAMSSFLVHTLGR